MTPVSHGKPCAGNPHARFDEGAPASEKPRRNALLHDKLIYSDETYEIKGAIFEVYKTLGAGFLEAVYQESLEEELKLRGIPLASHRCETAQV